MMRQSRLESYFKIPARLPPPHCLGLLDLPFSVRRLIYEYAGLAGKTIDLNFSNLLIYPEKQYPDSTFALRPRCVHVRIPVIRRWDETAPVGENEYWEVDNEGEALEGDVQRLLMNHCVGCSDGRGLLFVCKKISQEVVPFVYSNNVFTVRQGSPHGLKRVRSMGKDGMAALASLTIKLDTNNERPYFDAGDIHESLPTPLHLNDRNMRAVIREHETIIERLAKHIKPNSLSLYLIFRVATIDMLKTLLHPLSQLPTLKELGIWTFAGFSDAPRSLHLQYPQFEETERIVESTVRRLTSNWPTKGLGFCYSGLPTELRLQILGFTDLVSNDDIQWRPQDRSPPRENIQVDCFDCQGYPSDILEEAGGCVCQSIRSYCCENEQKEIVCCYRCRPVDTTRMCFCSSRGRVYSTTCVCRPPRHALFSVSRQVREDAIATYYSRNRFLVTPYGSPTMRSIMAWHSSGWPPDGIRGLYSIELSLYLSTVTRNALQYIRWLEWLLPNSQAEYLLPNTRAWFDYLDTLDMMRHAMNIRNLTFVLNMAAQGHRPWHYRTPPVAATAWRWYGQIALALRRLGPLKDCFIYLSRNTAASRVNDRIRCEESLEKVIMGKQYDSTKRGKPKERITAIAERYRGFPIYYTDPDR